MTEPEPPPLRPASKKPRAWRVVLTETTPGEMARKTSMLFCSSVATEGSVMPAMLAVALLSSLLKAAVGCCRRAPQRSKQATPTAAKSADRSATAIIWRAEIRYMAFFSDEFISFSKRLRQLRCRAERAALRASYVGPCPVLFAADSTTKPRRNRFAAPHRPNADDAVGAHRQASNLIQTVWRKSSSVAFMPIAEWEDLNIESMSHRINE